MKSSEPLYLAPETLYRIGNASSPLLTKVRPHEIDTIEVNGVRMIVANGKGVSLYNKRGLELAPLSGWVWEIREHSAIPSGLRLNRDPRPEGHYSLCPAKNMSVHEFLALLEGVVIHCRKVFKKQA